MKICIIAIACLSYIVTSSCQRKKTSVEVTETFRNSENGIDTSLGELPPPTDAIRKKPILNVNQWFDKICKVQKKKNNDIVMFKLAIFETDDFFAIYLRDVNDSTISLDADENYSRLSKDDYKGMPTVLDAMNKLKQQIKTITASSQFHLSPLANAKSITIIFDDESRLKIK